MPGRRVTQRPPNAVGGASSSSSSSTRSKKPQRKQKKRVQNALAVAEAEADDVPALRRSRYGEIDEPPRKRQRGSDDDEDGDGDGDEDDGEPGRSGRGGGAPAKRARRTGLRERYGKDADLGSDSEGNEWVTGQVDDEDDESLDSDEAFGESDEERFEGFAFRGSTSRKPAKKGAKQPPGNLLDEDDEGFEGIEDEYDSGEESDNFKENAVDLATMLDDHFSEEASEDEATAKRARQHSAQEHGTKSRSESFPRSYEDEDEDEEIADRRSVLSLEADDDDELAQMARLNAMQEMIAGLGNGDTTEAEERKARSRAMEALAPTNGVVQSEDTAQFFEGLSPEMRKLLGGETAKPSSKRSKNDNKGIPGLVEAPLPQRQQGRLDRAAAKKEATDQIGRWTDTVKQNRRADHLSFPLANLDEESAKNANRLQPLLADSRPFNDLEATIQRILLESGMGPKQGKSQEEQVLEMEGLAENKLSLEEVKARRADLRKARELLFREEIKAKRIKKIKSKSYRRVHRKERERNLLKQHEADAEAGVEPDEDDQERLDRLRAEERMGAKHRESKWARAMKATGRTAWDEDARNGVIDMARREEDLKRRIHGQAVQDGSGGDFSDSDDSDGIDGDKLDEKLFRLRDDAPASGPGSKLASMKFMQRAEAARREQNDAAIAEALQDLNGEGTPEASDSEETGRRRFGPQKQVVLPLQKQENRNEFEERDESDAEDSRFPLDDDDGEIEVVTKKSPSTKDPNGDANSQRQLGRKRGSVSKPAEEEIPQEQEENPWTVIPRKHSKGGSRQLAELDTLAIRPDDNTPSITEKPMANKGPKRNSKQSLKQVRLLQDDADDETSSSEDSDDEKPNHQSQRKLVKQAFAGDEADASFENEKLAVEKDERTPSPEADILPGWGSWTGTGLNKRDRKERARRNQSLQQKAAAEVQATRKGKHINMTRKDAGLDKVIISEKRVPKTAKYLATTLPHPFETRAQYERSLRLPMGPEWTTKETHQASTKPRVLVGGGVIKAMGRPMV